MDFFKNRDNVDLYTTVIEGCDNSFIISEVEKVLSYNSTILELGMGTGVDLIELSKKYKVIGSDYSEFFISDFKKKNDLEVCILDAITLDIDKKFDCIYSNKVLCHLEVEDFKISLENQYNHLTDNGIVFMTLWNGDYKEEVMFDGELRFVYYTKEILEEVIPKSFKFENVIYYGEFENMDSMIVILRKI